MGPSVFATNDDRVDPDPYEPSTSDFFAVEGDADDLDFDPLSQEQSESMVRSVEDVRGKFTRGTKANPEKGEFDPQDIYAKETDLLAGGEQATLNLSEMIPDEDREQLRTLTAAKAVALNPSPPDQPKPKRRRSVKSAETADKGSDSDSASVAPKKPTTTRRTRQAVPLYASLEENSTRYGMDESGNRTPTRFQWWQRATSRDPRSKEAARRALVTRRAPLVRRLTAQEYWYKPLKLYTEQ